MEPQPSNEDHYQSDEFANSLAQALEKDGLQPDFVPPKPEVERTEPKPEQQQQQPPSQEKKSDVRDVQQRSESQTSSKEAENDPPPEGFTTKAADSWRALREKKDAEIQTLAAQLEELKQQQPQVPADYDELKQTNQEISDRLKLLDITQHPEFQRKYDGEASKVLETTKNLVGSEHASTVDKILNASTSLKERDELLSGLEDQIGKIGVRKIERAMDRLDEIRMDRQEAINSAKENYDLYQRQQQDHQRQQQEYANQVFEQTLEKVAKENPAFQQKEGDSEWNKSLNESLQTARHLYNGKLNPDQAAMAALNSAAFPRVLQQAVAQGQEIERLNNRIKELEGAKPDPTSGNAPSQQSSDDFKPVGEEKYQDDLARRAAETLGNQW